MAFPEGGSSPLLNGQRRVMQGRPTHFGNPRNK